MIDKLTPYQAIAFLRSCIRSGEQLNSDDDAQIDAVLEDLRAASPVITDADLEKAAFAWLEAGRRYWDTAHRLGRKGAVIWVKDEDGALFVFTRGEYEWALTQAIASLPNQDDVHYFSRGECDG